MAGVPGFEPGNAEIKTPCLTTWRHPMNKDLIGIDPNVTEETKRKHANK